MNNVVVGLRQAVSAQYEPEIVVTGWAAPDPGQAWLKMPPVSLRPRKLLGFLYRLLPNMLRVVRISRGAAVLNPHYFGSEVLPLVVLRKLRLVPKLILSVHGADVTEGASGSAFERAVYRFICNSADAVVACSGALAEEARAVCPRARIITVLNGILPPPAELGPRPLAEPYLLSVSAFVKKKAHDVLIEAFRQVAAEFPDLKFILIGGKGPERNRVEQMIRDARLENRIQLITNLTHGQVWRWMHHAEVFVHAARVEPFGTVVMEAGLVRVPIVTTAVGGIREYLTSGVDGLTCEPDQPEQLAAAIRETLNNPAHARARASTFYQKARLFTWESAWDRYQKAAGLH